MHSFRIRIEEETRRLQELRQKQEEEEQRRFELERLRLLEVRKILNQWQIQDFLDGKGTTTYYLINFSQQLHENEDIFPIGVGEGLLDPPM